jgi:hypothetical protein
MIYKTQKRARNVLRDRLYRGFLLYVMSSCLLYIKRMRRYHLFEFEDLNGFPDVWRRAMTRYLKTAVNLFPLPGMWADKLATLGPGEGRFQIVDLGSGSGGSMSSIIPALRRKGYTPDVTLTDLYPNPDAVAEKNASTEGALRYWPMPVDATAVPAELRGTRTMFLSFHHHPPERARAILRDAFEKRVGIAVLEFSARKPSMLLSCVQVPLAVLFLTPLIRPLKASQLLFTYVVPVVPLLMFWDALVSHLRTYSPEELREMTAEMQAPDYVWETGEFTVPRAPGAFPWLTGRPQQAAAEGEAPGAASATV